jgi:acyl-CoA thioesterase YciA
VVFHQPVFVGDIVAFYEEVALIGKTSITIKVIVEAERWRGNRALTKVTEAEIVYVNVDADRKPAPIVTR